MYITNIEDRMVLPRLKRFREIWLPKLANVWVGRGPKEKGDGEVNIECNLKVAENDRVLFVMVICLKRKNFHINILNGKNNYIERYQRKLKIQFIN